METTIVCKIKRYNTYKDSGVEWLGEIPEHWELKRFKFLAVANKGKLPKKIVSENEANLPPYMSMEYLRGGLENQWVDDKNALIINSNEILLLWDGSNSGEFIKSRKGVISSTVAHIVFNEINNNYAWYHSKVLEIELRKNTTGMGIPHVNGRFLNNTFILLPPENEQTAIAEFMDDKTEKIDQAISIKEQQIALLKERKQILIHKAVTRGLDDSVPLKDSGVEWIGEIPEHWEVKSLRYAFEFLNYKRIPLSATEREKMQGKYPYYGASGIIDYVDNYIFDEKLILIGEDGANLLSKSTPLAFVAEGKYWVNNHAHILRPKYDGFPYWAEQLSLIDYTIFISGAAQPKLSRGNLSAVKVIVPILKDLKEISSHIESTSQKIDTAISLKTQEIEKLKEYKSSLINSVVTGKVKVS